MLCLWAPNGSCIFTKYRIQINLTIIIENMYILDVFTRWNWDRIQCVKYINFKMEFQKKKYRVLSSFFGGGGGRTVNHYFRNLRVVHISVCVCVVRVLFSHSTLIWGWLEKVINHIWRASFEQRQKFPFIYPFASILLQTFPVLKIHFFLSFLLTKLLFF